MDPTAYISLATPLSRAAVTVIGANELATVQIVTDDWGSAVVRAVWSLDGINFVAFTPDIQMSTSKAGRERFAISGPKYLAFEIVTADGDADSNAELWLELKKL